MAIIINFRADTSSVVKAVQEVEGQVAAFSDQSSQAVASGIVLACWIMFSRGAQWSP